MVRALEMTEKNYFYYMSNALMRMTTGIESITADEANRLNNDREPLWVFQGETINGEPFSFNILRRNDSVTLKFNYVTILYLAG